jgi:hypothetical protein
MLENIEIYKNTKRNEKCPCGSNEIFKKCCMKEYREIRKNGGTKLHISTYSPIKPLEDEDKQSFTSFYSKLMIFSNQHRFQTEDVIIENKKENMQNFIQKERDFFYKKHIEIINKYIEEKNPNKEELIILKSLKDAKLDNFFLLSSSDDTAVIMDNNANIYNIQALNSPFSEIFIQKEKYGIIQTALIPYKDRYISDGIFTYSPAPKESYQYIESIPYQNPEIIYNKDNDIINIELDITFAIGSNTKNTRTMEEALLKKVPKRFFIELQEQLKNEFSYSTNIISSFIRTTDFLELLESEEGDKTLSYIFGGLPVTNFDKGNKDGVISHEILEYYYKQVPIEKSISFEAYNKIKNQKRSIFSRAQAFSSFYSILCITSVKKSDFDNFMTFIETFKTKEKREPIALGIENLCEDLSKELGFIINPVFIDISVGLDEIRDNIIEYHNYMKEIKIPSVKNAKKYSIQRGQK